MRENHQNRKRKNAAQCIAVSYLALHCGSVHAAAPDLGMGAIAGFIVYGTLGLLALALLLGAAAIGKKTLVFTSLTLFVFLPGTLYYLKWKDERLLASNREEVERLCRATPYRIFEKGKPAAVVRMRTMYWNDKAYDFRDRVLRSAENNVASALSGGNPVLKIEKERPSENPKEQSAQFEILIEDIFACTSPKQWEGNHLHANINSGTVNPKSDGVNV